MREFAFAGRPERVTPGRQVWAVTNAGEQAHELYVAEAPAGTTLADVRAAPAGADGATPSPDAPDLGALRSAGGMASLSPGRTGWAVSTWSPGPTSPSPTSPRPWAGSPPSPSPLRVRRVALPDTGRSAGTSRDREGARIAGRIAGLKPR